MLPPVVALVRVASEPGVHSSPPRNVIGMAPVVMHWTTVLGFIRSIRLAQLDTDPGCSQRWLVVSGKLRMALGDAYDAIFRRGAGRSRAAMLAYWARYCYWALGGYRKYRAVDWRDVRRLVFVCRGNICRSAYAEYWGKARGLPAASLGVDTAGDGVADVTASRVAKNRDISLEEHRTTPISRFEAEKGDLLIAMEPAHVDVVESQDWTAPYQITLLGLWIDSHGAVISDPYGGDDAFFGDCFSLIEAGIKAMEEQMAR